MLIDEAIEAAKLGGKLIPARPVVPWAGEPRAFLMCQCLRDEIKEGQQNKDPGIRKRWAQLEADISLFIEGGYVTSDFLKQLDPWKFEHWELISRRPKPSIRVFGRFAKPDVFIGTHTRLRGELGKKWSPQFENTKLVCEDHWKDAGLPIEPPPGAFTDAPYFRYEAYVTSNASRELKVPS